MAGEIGEFGLEALVEGLMAGEIGEFGLEALVGPPHYPNIEPDVPPANEPVQVGERWWGCKDWLVRGAPPAGIEPRAVPAESVSHVSRAEQLGPTAGEALLAPAARWGVFHNEGQCAYVPIGAAPGHALNPLYLTFVGAAAEVEDWSWLPDAHMKRDGEVVTNAGFVVGLRNGIAVAIIAPCVFRRADQ